MTTKSPGASDDDLLTTPEAAKLLRLSVSTLERMRGQGAPSDSEALRFIKLGQGKRSRVLYSRQDIEHWLERQRFQSTSEYRRSRK